MATKNTDFKAAVGQLEDTLELYLVKKAPFSLPGNIKELIVNVAPWLTLVFLILSVPAILLAFGLGALVAPFTVFLGPGYAVSYGVSYLISMAALAVAVVLQALAVPGLFRRERKAWTFLFYASLVGVFSSVVGGNVIGGLVGGLIGLYFLFQIREYYK
jgi:hypothetical protein